MARYEVSFNVDLPDGVAFSEVEKFIRFELGEINSVRFEESSPFTRTDLASCEVSGVYVREL